MSCPLRAHPYKKGDEIPICPRAKCLHVLLPNEDACPCHEPTQGWEETAIDHKRYALRQAIKSIVPPPYILQVGDIEALRQNGFTGATAHIENQRRQDEYENTVDRVEKYITELLAQKDAEKAEMMREREAEKKALVREIVAGVKGSFYQKIIGGAVIELFCTEKEILTTLTAIAEKHNVQL